MQLISFLEGSFLEKCGKIWVATAGLGKYRMGGYGWIGVYRAELADFLYIIGPQVDDFRKCPIDFEFFGET